MPHHLNWYIKAGEGHASIAPDRYDALWLNHFDEGDEERPRYLSLTTSVASIGEWILRFMRMKRKNIPEYGRLANFREEAPNDGSRALGDERSAGSTVQCYTT